MADKIFEKILDKVADSEKTLIAYFSLPENTGAAREDSSVTVNRERLEKLVNKFNRINEVKRKLIK